MAFTSFSNSILRKEVILFLKRFTLLENWNSKLREHRGEIFPDSEIGNLINVGDEVILSSVPERIRVGLVKDSELDAPGYFARRASWPKYERFLKNNNIHYSYYDIHASEWQAEAEKFDIVIWHPQSTPDFLSEAKSKIYFLEKYLKKRCYPSFAELWSYEDKIHANYLYNLYGLPHVTTFISYSKDDARKFIYNTTFPVIAKINTGSASCGVEKLNNIKSALRYIYAVFSKTGRKTYHPYERQVNYVYFQNFIKDSKFDLRVIVVGNKIFGYYRYPKTGDFRASGAGIIEKKELPEKAMRLAIRTKELFKATSLAVDMLYSEGEQIFYIIETSIFCGIDTAEQLVIDGKPGYYEYAGDQFIFKEGRFWIQELALQDFFTSLVKT